jgi:endonuclease III
MSERQRASQWLSRDRTVALLLERHGRTFADRAGIRLADKPSPLYRLLVLATLLSARITAEVAVAAARELGDAGYQSPRAMREASWQDRVDALGRGHYRRYDERTATMLDDSAAHCLDRWGGDLRRMHAEAGADTDALSRLLQEFKGIGPTGASIFLREVQGVWPDIAPYVDQRVSAGAGRVGLPTDAAALAALVPAKELPRLTAALVEVARNKKAADAVRGAVERARG